MLAIRCLGEENCPMSEAVQLESLPSTEFLSPLGERAVLQTSRIISTLTAERTIGIENATEQGTSRYVEEILFPAVKKARFAQNEDKQKKLPDSRIERIVFDRCTELQLYALGTTIESIAEKSNLSVASIKGNISRTLRLIKCAPNAENPDYFRSEFMARNPNARLLKRPAPVSTIGRIATNRNREDNSDKTIAITQDLVGQYLREISRTPLLNQEQEISLSKRIEAGLVAQSKIDCNDTHESGLQLEELEWLAQDGQRAKKALEQANLRLVVSLARRYSYSGMDLLDLIQEGNLGLIHAVKKFDYTKGYKFSTYATWWINQSIRRGIAIQARTVRIPTHAIDDMYAITKVTRMLEEDNITPNVAAIAKKTGFSQSRIHDLIVWKNGLRSLDEPIGDDNEATLGDLVVFNTPIKTNPSSPQENTLFNDELFGHLSDREADVIRKKYGLFDGAVWKIADIAASHGCSEELIRQLNRKALAILRRHISYEDIV